MIIGFDGSRAFATNKTGTENYSYQLLSYLAKIDHQNQYLVYLRPGTQGDALRGWPQNFKFITIPSPRLWTQFGLAKQTFLDRDLDILFVPSHTLPLIRCPGLKTVVTVHDLGAEYLPQTHQIKQRLYLKFMTDYQIKSATHLIAVSQATKDDLIKKVGVPAEKISVVYEGYNEKLFRPAKTDTLNTILKQFELKPQEYFLFVGTIQPRKNLERLIKAYSEVFVGDGKWGAPLSARNETRTSNGAASRQDPQKQPKLVLAGSKGWLSEEIYVLPKKLGIETSVKFLGYVPDEKLPALYTGAKAFLFPSLFEGFGLPILEAFACKCPVLTSNISSMPEVAGDATLLINPYSEEEITQGIERLATDEKLRNRLVKEGQKQLKKFSWEKAASQTLEVLKKAVGNTNF